ncbi:TrkA family potassium uptake protein [Nonomuraea sp. B12E4]|uniref:potassium channel family protein n=1 Tax=Nonomuraea sp. B12E4 TaxID=3153564 RepID=UPI00325C35E8
MVDQTSDPVVVIGLGRFGAALAAELVRRGSEVLAIDHRPAAAHRLAGQVTDLAIADATDMDELRRLGVPDFSRAVVAIGTAMEASILSASLLVELNVEQVWAKAISRHHGQILHRIGVHHVVFPEHDMGERVAHLVSGRMLDFMQVDEHFALVRMRPPKECVGMPLGRSGARRRYGVTIVAVKSPGADFTYATAETELTYDDVVLVSGRTEQVERFAELP